VEGPRDQRRVLATAGLRTLRRGPARLANPALPGLRAADPQAGVEVPLLRHLAPMGPQRARCFRSHTRGNRRGAPWAPHTVRTGGRAASRPRSRSAGSVGSRSAKA
jgi:hypothetical protein